MAARPHFELSYLHPRHWGTWLVAGLVWICAWLPRRWSLRFGALMGDLFFRVNAKRRRIARINVAMCFPELSAAEREDMVRRHFRVYGQNVVDMGLIWWRSDRRLSQLTELRGAEGLAELVRNGTNVILFTPHAVGLDLGGLMVSRLHPAVSMMKTMKDPLLNYLVLRGRYRYPESTLVMRDEGMRPLIRAIRSGKVGYFMPDEDFGAERSVFVPFFGVPTATLPILGRMARLANAVAAPCFTRLDPATGTYTVTVKAPLDGFPSGDAAADATRMNAELEAGIREAPEQYMWTLRWFKTRPDGAPSPYDVAEGQDGAGSP